MTTLQQVPGAPAPAKDPMHDNQVAKRKTLSGRILTHALLLVGVALSVFPFYWLMVMSTNTTADIFGYPPKLIFGDSFVTNIKNLFTSVDMLRAVGITLFVSSASAILVMFFDSLAAFAFAKYDFPGKKVLFAIIIATFIIPGQLSLVPSFVLMSEFGWIGSLKALVIPGAANAFGIFLLRQFATTSIPDSLIESAIIDGAGFWKTYWNIGIPMLRGGLAFLGIFTFIASWNDYVWPLIVMIDPMKQPLQVALAQLSSVYSTDYGLVMTGAFISVLPLIGIFLIGSRHFIANIAAGAVKE